MQVADSWSISQAWMDMELSWLHKQWDIVLEKFWSIDKKVKGETLHKNIGRGARTETEKWKVTSFWIRMKKCSILENVVR